MHIIYNQMRDICTQVFNGFSFKTIRTMNASAKFQNDLYSLSKNNGANILNLFENSKN